MRVSVAQFNPVVGDIGGNLSRIKEALAKSVADKPDLLVFPELFLTGYPPKDLLERNYFLEKCDQAAQAVIALSGQYPDTAILYGRPCPSTCLKGKGLANSALLVYRGEELFRQDKSLLPFYDVFDESRYFDPAERIEVFPFKDEVLGISLCEDAWNNPEFRQKKNTYPFDPIDILAQKGATFLINISASPFSSGKEKVRFELIKKHALKHRLPFLYVNQVGANDELIFDGRSFCLNGKGECISLLPPFKEASSSFSTSSSKVIACCPEGGMASIHDALVLGIKDYMRKCGFSKVLVGLSGGIDSAITCCLAREAAGGANVTGISMPSPWSSDGSVKDSRKLASNLGIGFKVIPIGAIHACYLESLAEDFSGLEPDETEENIQARIRGNILMAYANKFGGLLLSTGNKSELSVGYCTLYGDMCGGLGVLADVPKTTVYELARYINSKRNIIPDAIIAKLPSAELRPGQLDQDTLPPYEVMDRILYYYIEEGLMEEELVEKGFDPGTVRWVQSRVLANEFKRNQAPPALRISAKAFGTGRRMPVAARHRYKPEEVNRYAMP